MIDTHCHLEKIDYNNIEEIINKCKEKNIEKIIVSGYDLNSSIEAVKLANKYDFIYATVGFLPEVLENEKYCLKKLEKLLKNTKVVGIGEIGLDYHFNKENKETQKKLFVEQIYLAKKYNKPIVIHCREAIQDCYDILKDNNVELGTMHCYSGNLEMAKKFINLGINISIGGVSTFKNSIYIKEVIKHIPLSYLLLETDSPYLTPEPYRGKKNYPYYISIIAENIAKIKAISVIDVAKTTSDNAYKLFDF